MKDVGSETNNTERDRTIAGDTSLRWDEFMIVYMNTILYPMLELIVLDQSM